MPPRLPLDSFPVMRANSLRAIHDIYARLFAGAKILSLQKGGETLEAQGNFCRLPHTTIWSTAYGVPLKMSFAENALLRLHYSIGGSAEISVARQSFAIRENQGCILSAGTSPIVADYGADYKNVVFYFQTDHLKEKLGAMTGTTVHGAVTFDSKIDFANPEAARLQRTTRALLECLDAFGPHAPSLFLAELEQMLIVALLCCSRHSHSHLLEGGPPASAAPWQVQRAEQFIEAHWDRPVTIEQISMASGVSARSLFRLFKQTRGCSPMDFAKQVRLQRAKQMIDAPSQQTTVTEIAFACGFGDPGRFSREFRQRFGELPSHALRRSQGKSALNREM